MTNLITLNVVYDSSGQKTGLNDIDLICSISTDNKKISSSMYDTSVDPPLKVSNQIDHNTKILTKIEDCNGSYYLVSDSYEKISDAQESNGKFYQTESSSRDSEVDPVFTASSAHDITPDHIIFLNGKDYNSLNNLPDLSLKADLVSGKVPASQLPSYVDDVVEAANLATLPASGENGKIYVTLETNKIYRWSGSAYVDMTPGETDTLNTVTSRNPVTNNSITVSGLKATSLQGDTTYTKTIIAKPDGTFGWEDKASSATIGGVLPTIKILDYTQDATNYILRVSYTYSQATPSGNPQFEVVIHSAFIKANNITTTQDSVNQSTFSTNNGIGITGFITTILIPKASNTSAAWNNDIIGIMVRLLSIDNGDGGANSTKIVRRIAVDMNLIGNIKPKVLVDGSVAKEKLQDYKGSDTLNNMFLFGAGNWTSTGSYSLAIGREALKSIQTGSAIVAIGNRALKNHKTENSNVAIGADAMMNSETCNDCSLIGHEAGLNMKGGVGDTGMGRRSISRALWASNNTAFGDSTLFRNKAIQGSDISAGNVAVGYVAMEYGFKNTATVGIGKAAGRFTNSTNNVLIGDAVLYGTTLSNEDKEGTTVDVITTAENVTAIGAMAMNQAKNGCNENTVVGQLGLYQVEGIRNTTVGLQSGYNVTTGNRNTLIGWCADATTGSVSNSIAIGYNVKSTKNNQVVIGNIDNDEFVFGGVVFTKAQLEALKALVS